MVDEHVREGNLVENFNGKKVHCEDVEILV
jgi:hypothetical protein